MKTLIDILQSIAILILGVGFVIHLITHLTLGRVKYEVESGKRSR